MNWREHKKKTGCDDWSVGGEAAASPGITRTKKQNGSKKKVTPAVQTHEEEEEEVMNGAAQLYICSVEWVPANAYACALSKPFCGCLPDSLICQCSRPGYNPNLKKPAR